MMGYINIGIALVIFCVLAVAANTTPPPSCLPGFEPTSSGCKQCDEGKYSKDGEQCLTCSVCHRGHELFHPCERNRNAYCICPKGKYERRSICEVCTVCNPGFVMKRACGHNLDTECEECPKGMTTNSTDSKKCISKSNVIPDINYNQYTISKGTTFDWKIILALVAALIVILLGVFFCVFFCRRKRRERNNNRLQNIEEDMLMNAAPNIEFELPEKNHRDVGDLTADILEDLGKKLNVKSNNNWKTLAGLLGFTQEDVSVFELAPLNAVQGMLYDYSTRTISTVYNLHFALVAMNREDAARIVRPYIYT